MRAVAESIGGRAGGRAGVAHDSRPPRVPLFDREVKMPSDRGHLLTYMPPTVCP